MAADGSIETKNIQRLNKNQDKQTPNGTAEGVLPIGQTQSRSTSSRQIDSGCHKMRLNIGGVVFKTHSQTLQRFPQTRLAKLTTQDDSYDPDDKEFFFDRNSLVFHGILDYYRTGELHVPHNICAQVVHNELTFWGFQDKVRRMNRADAFSRINPMRPEELFFCPKIGLQKKV